MKITHEEFLNLCKTLSAKIKASEKKYKAILPVPNGGFYPAIEISRLLDIPVINHHHLSIYEWLDVLVIDDLIDSGKTLSQYHFDKAVLISKNRNADKVAFSALEIETEWVEFPWENTEKDAKDLVTRQLEYLGENPNREGLKDTPTRVVKMWKEIFRGYDKSQKPKMALFKNGSDGITCDEMIVDTGRFYSHCEHHMVPFFGQYWFAYIPNPDGMILGLSKVARIVDFHCAKLQIQERLVHDIVEDIHEELSRCGQPPLGIALVMKGEHLCKTMRGVKKEGQMSSSYIKGVFKTEHQTRQEFLNFIK